MNRYPGYEPQPPEDECVPEPRAEAVDEALTVLAGSQAGLDGATYAAEFMQNLDTEHANAMSTFLYVHCAAFRTAFAEAYGKGVRQRLQEAA